MGKKSKKKERHQQKKKLEQLRLKRKDKEKNSDSSVLQDVAENTSTSSEEISLQDSSYSDMEVAQILLQLTTNEGFFPRSAIFAAIAKKDQMIPQLLKIISLSPHDINEFDSHYMAHIYAMYLMAQFREKKAYPLIVDFFSGSGELAMNLTGDVVTEGLGRILAGVCCGDISLITSLIENPKANEFVRSAALRSLLVLVVCGEKPREEIMCYYKNLFRGKLEREYSMVWDSLVSYSCDLYPYEVIDDITKAFEDYLVDPMYVNLEDVDQALADGKEKTLSRAARGNDLIRDVIEEMHWWHCFQSSLYSPKVVHNRKKKKHKKKIAKASKKKNRR